MSDTGTEQESSYNIIRNSLRQYGLEGLETFIGQMVFESGIVDAEQVLARLRVEPETTEAGRIYQQRFSANKARVARGLSSLSEAQYLAMEQSLKTQLRVMGMPEGFYDSNDDVDQFIAADVSVAELGSRIEDGYRAVRDADPDVVNQMQRLYGVGERELAAYFLDPERGLDIVQRQAQAARIASEARQEAGFDVGVTTAEELAREGITEQQARSGFAGISELEQGSKRQLVKHWPANNRLRKPNRSVPCLGHRRKQRNVSVNAPDAAKQASKPVEDSPPKAQK